MINFDNVINKKKIEHNSKWPHISGYPYRILVTGGSELGKTNTLLNLINYQSDIDKIYLYAKDSYEANYQFLMKKLKDVRTKHLNDSKAFIEY